MAIVSHTVTTTPQSSTRMNVVYTFTDHLGGTTVVNKLQPNGTDTNAEALAMYALIEAQLADREINEAVGVAERLENPDKVADHQSQADFDRRLCGRLMTLEDAHHFLAALPFWQAVEFRGGANANQRAAYLVVPRPEYDLVAGRFGDVQGAATFLNDDKGHIWREGALEGWE